MADAENEELRRAVEHLRRTISLADEGWQLPRDVTRALLDCADRIERVLPPGSQGAGDS